MEPSRARLSVWGRAASRREQRFSFARVECCQGATPTEIKTFLKVGRAIVDSLGGERRVSGKPLSRPSGQVNDRAARRRYAYSCAYAENAQKRSEPIVAPKRLFA